MRISKAISIILHPIFMPLVAFYLSLKLAPSIGYAITNFIGFVFLILIVSTIIMPLLSNIFFIKKKIINSIEMTCHRERFFPLLSSAIWMGYGYYKIADILAYAPILQSEIICMIIIIIIGCIISKYWKISLHMLAIGGVVGVIFSLNVIFGGLTKILIISFLFTGLLGVARINEKAHSHAQIYTGFIIGFIIESLGILLF